MVKLLRPQVSFPKEEWIEYTNNLESALAELGKAARKVVYIRNINAGYWEMGEHTNELLSAIDGLESILYPKNEVSNR